jgi:uncharacterized coiled-coil protein SlyX
MEATAEAAEAASRALSERVAPLEGGLAQQSYAQEDLEGRMHEAQAAMEEVTSHVQSQLEHVHRALQQEQQDATAAVQVREFSPNPNLRDRIDRIKGWEAWTSCADVRRDAVCSLKPSMRALSFSLRPSRRECMLYFWAARRYLRGALGSADA